MAGSANMKYQLLLPLQSKAKVKEFLKAIREKFVSTVNPLESGLEDGLIQCCVLTNTDTESLEGGHLPTRAEKARRLWQILYHIHHEVFIRDVLPVLCEMYDYIIPPRFWRIADSTGPGSTGEGVQEGASAPPSAHDSPEKCTRCVMQNRIRAVTLADFLFKIGVIPDELYCQLTKNIRTSEPDWQTLFGAFARLPRPGAMRHEQELTTLLQRHNLHVPENLVDLMTRGFPCQCPQLPACRKVDSVTKSAMTEKRLAMLLHLERLRDRRSSDASIASDVSSISVYPPSESDDGSHITFDTESLTSEFMGVSSRSVRHHLASSGNSRSVDIVGTRTFPRCRGSITSSTQNQSNKGNTWHGRKRPRGSNPKFLSGENLQGTFSGSQESLVSAVLSELEDARNPLDADDLSDVGAQTFDESSDDAKSDQSSDYISREPQPDYTEVAPYTERQNKPQQECLDNEQIQARLEHPSSLTTAKADVYHTFPRKSAKPKKPVRAVSDFFDRISKNKAQRESESNTAPAQPSHTNITSSSEGGPNSQDESRVTAQPLHIKPNSDTDSSTSDSATKIARKVETLTLLPLASSSPELAASSERQSSGKMTSSLSSPADLLPPKLSPDDEKFKCLSKALYKEDCERHHLVPQGTLPSNTIDRVSEHCQDDDVNQEEVSEPLRVSRGISVEHLSQQCRKPLIAEHTGESEATEKDATENSDSSFDDVTGEAPAPDRRDLDLQEFLDFASNNITTAKQLTQIIKHTNKAVIVDVNARKEANYLLQDYRDLECHYAELRQRLDTLQQSGDRGEQNPALPPMDNPHPALSEVFQPYWQVLNLCEDMLIFRRTFILCVMYLNTLPRLTSQSTRDRADTVAHDSFVLLEEKSLEALQCVQRLDELREQLPVGVVSLGLLEIISSMRTFLERS